MRSFLLLSMLTLAGCAMGPSAETRVEELRVLAITIEPPEIGPDETTAIDSLVVDPDGQGFDLLRWTCTRAGSACLEAEDPDTAWAGLSLVEDADAGWYPGEYTLPSFLAGALDEDPLPLVQHWTLACAPGLCPVIQAAAKAGPGARALQAQLSDPFTFMERLPMRGVSLARSTVLASTRTTGRLENPTVDCAPQPTQPADALEVERGGSLRFVCAVSGDFDGDAGVWGHATAGGWEGAVQGLSPGDAEVEYRYIAPGRAGAVELWVVITDGNGGLGIWEGVLDIR